MKLISIDIETTGLDPDMCQTIEVAAIVYDTEKDKGKSLVDLPTFERKIVHYEYHWEPYAYKMNKAMFEPLLFAQEDLVKNKFSFEYSEETKFCSARSFFHQFKAFVSESYGEGSVLPLGKNFSGFDHRFLRRLPNFSLIKFGHRVLDPAMLFLEDGDKTPPNLTECLRRAGIEKEVAHNALEDAWDTILCFEHGRKLLK